MPPWLDQIQPILIAAVALLTAAITLARLLPHPAKRNVTLAPPDRGLPMTPPRLTLQHWLFLALGKACPPEVEGAFQCVSLVNFYLRAVRGLPDTTVPRAVDLSTIKLGGMTWTPNDTTNQPQEGSVVVWGPDARVGTGSDGHTSICVIAGQLYLITADQNWSGHQFAEAVGHDYRGILGWHTPT